MADGKISEEALSEETGSEVNENVRYALEDWISLFVLCFLGIVVFQQVISRYLFQLPMSWTEEVARVLLIFLTFLGASMAVRRNSHVAVNFLLSLSSRNTRRYISIAQGLCQVLFYGICSFLVIRVAILLTPQRLASIDVSLGVVYGVVASGFVLMCFRACINVWKQFRGEAKQPDVETGGSPL